MCFTQRHFNEIEQRSGPDLPPDKSDKWQGGRAKRGAQGGPFFSQNVNFGRAQRAFIIIFRKFSGALRANYCIFSGGKGGPNFDLSGVGWSRSGVDPALTTIAHMKKSVV